MPTFRGFRKPTYTPVPDELFDELLPELGHAELKVLLYIIRRTFGFKKDADAISFNQFLHGITTTDGRVLDTGCGIKKASNISSALKSLEEKGIITATKAASETGEKATTVYALHFTNGVLPQKEYPPPERSVPVLLEKEVQETDIQETVKQDTYPSKIRKAKSDEFDYVNTDGSTEEAPESARLTHNERVEHGQTHSITNHRNIEETKTEKNIPPAATRAAAQPSSTTEQNRKGGLAHIGQTLQDKLPMAAPAPDDAVARDAIERYIRDTAAKLHDEAPLKSSVTRAWNDYKRSGVDLNRFFNELYDAEKEANRRSATIKKLTEMGFKNRMAYFFAILEDKLGLRQKPPPDTAGRS